MKAEILKVELNDKYNTYKEALEHLTKQDVKHLGWINSGIRVPKGNYVTVFKNWSGSSTLLCDVTSRIAYSVDMGD